MTALEPFPGGTRHGVTYNHARDSRRLTKQAQDVYAILRDGCYHTLREISLATGHPEASVSARIRECRDPKRGGFTIDKECLGRGLWRYRLVLPRGQLELL